jgi:hypothetical protein
MVPCYVCGEWYSEQQFALYDQMTGHLIQVIEGKDWHEQGQVSLRHCVAERQVRQWLEQVVVSRVVRVAEEEQAVVPTTEETIPTKAMGRPTSYMIPQEILDPSCRSPGFRIKEKKEQMTTEASDSTPATEMIPVTPPASPRSSLQFTFTSERFRAAVQEASHDQPPSHQQQQLQAEQEMALSSSAEAAKGLPRETPDIECDGPLFEEPKTAQTPKRIDAMTIPSSSETAPLTCTSYKAVRSSNTPLASASMQPALSPKAPSWSIVRKTWRLTHQALIKPFTKSSSSSTPWLSCPKDQRVP